MVYLCLYIRIMVALENLTGVQKLHLTPLVLLINYMFIKNYILV